MLERKAISPSKNKICSTVEINLLSNRPLKRFDFPDGFNESNASVIMGLIERDSFTCLDDESIPPVDFCDGV